MMFGHDAYSMHDIAVLRQATLLLASHTHQTA